ncbi:hypothetical protein J6590_053710 [Homalodisca vitripennis]|nr:hypothetical protein J6590_053710 [Homalodisca vitripennis]
MNPAGAKREAVLRHRAKTTACFITSAVCHIGPASFPPEIGSATRRRIPSKSTHTGAFTAAALPVPLVSGAPRNPLWGVFKTQLSWGCGNPPPRSVGGPEALPREIFEILDPKMNCSELSNTLTTVTTDHIRTTPKDTLYRVLIVLRVKVIANRKYPVQVPFTIQILYTFIAVPGTKYSDSFSSNTTESREEVLEQSGNVTIREGKDTTIKCTAGASSEIISCVWLWEFPGRDHAPTVVAGFPGHGLNSSDCSINLVNVSQIQTGWWTCRAQTANTTILHSEPIFLQVFTAYRVAHMSVSPEEKFKDVIG